MALTRPIPERAMPIVAILRRDVRRPPYTTLRPFTRGSTGLRWFRNHETLCPIGLHPKATSQDPDDEYDALWIEEMFEPRTEHLRRTYRRAFYALIDWWDEQTDPHAAVHAIWPTKVATEEA